ncbi:MAG TPA: OmpH family outer membrane protein [Gammaproteobacteria bacterium]
MIIKSLSLAALLTASLGLATGAQAAELKIGIIKTQALMQKSPQAAAINAEMSKKFDQRKKDLEAKLAQLKTMEDDMSRNGSTMSQSQVQEEQTRHDEMQRDAGREQSDLVDDINAARNAAYSTMQQAVVKAAQEFAQAQKYSLILADSVVYADNAIDVTDQVLAQMQKDYKASGPATTGAAKSGN